MTRKITLINLQSLADLFKSSDTWVKGRGLPKDAKVVAYDLALAGDQGCVRLALESEEWPARGEEKEVEEVVLEIDSRMEESFELPGVDDEDEELSYSDFGWKKL